MSTALAAVPQSPLSKALAERGVDAAQWSTLINSLYPGAKPESALMVLDYCRARQLDPMKKPCHIVPISVKNAEGRWETRDVVMPGIYEHRTTAARTGEYRGHSKAEYGPEIDFKGIKAPAWCDMTIYRGERGQDLDEYPVRVLFVECCNTDKDGNPTQRWRKAPVQMLTKCTEAAGLREAFPDELGGEQTVEEMEGREMDPIDVSPVVTMPQPTGPAAAGAPATSQPEPARAAAPAPSSTPLVPTTANTAFRRDHVRITDMKPGRTQDKTNTTTGEITPGRPYALVTLSTGETFQCWHMNTLAPQLEGWKDAKTLVDLDCSTASDTKFRPRIEKGSAA